MKLCQCKAYNVPQLVGYPALGNRQLDRLFPRSGRQGDQHELSYIVWSVRAATPSGEYPSNGYSTNFGDIELKWLLVSKFNLLSFIA